MTDAPGVRPQPGSGERDDRAPGRDGSAVADARPLDDTSVFRAAGADAAGHGAADGRGASAPGVASVGADALGADALANGTGNASGAGLATGAGLANGSGATPPPLPATPPSLPATPPAPLPSRNGSPPSGSLTPPALPQTAPAPQARGRRRAKLAVASVDPWSVFRFTLVFSVTLLIVWVVVAAVLWSLLNGMHVFDSLTNLINDVIPNNNRDRTVDELFNFKRTMAWAAGLGVLNAILFTALGTLGSFIYNLCARIVGGIEVTLADRG